MLAIRALIVPVALAALLSAPLARADGEITIELKGVAQPPSNPAPPPPTRDPATQPERPKAPALGPQARPGKRTPGQGLAFRQHTGIMPRAGGPPVLPPAGDGSGQAGQPSGAPGQNFGQLAVTLARENPIFRKRDARSQILSRTGPNHYLVVQPEQQGWYPVLMADGTTGYIPATHLQLLNYRVTDVQLGGRTPVSPGPAPNEFVRILLQEAYRFMGTPYVWGGNDERGIDCSGYVKRCFAVCGVNLPRRASEQAMMGMPVEYSQLRTGDRIYFSVKKQYDHTGIYLGDGYFIHSGRSRGGVGVDHLSTPLYGRTLSAARR